MPDQMEATSLSSPAARRYCAFISYRHADSREEGRRWAEWLHQIIETYEVPKDLIGKTNERGETIPKSLYPVFRDEKELAADPSLKKRIELALANSGFLIVLCSPRACESTYVRDEIRRFKELGRSARIMALLLDGAPNTSSDEKKPGEGVQECLPEALRFGVDLGDGNIDWNQPSELPIAADTRPEGKPVQGYTTSNAYQKWLEEEKGLRGREARNQAASYEARLQQAKFKILAGLLGLSPGELLDRDAAHRLSKARRQRKIAFGVALGALGLIAIAVGQWREAKRQEGEATNARTQATKESKQAMRQEAQAKLAGYHAAIADAAAYLDQGKAQDAARMLDATAPELRHWEWGYLRARCDNTISTPGKVENLEPGSATDTTVHGFHWHEDCRTVTSISATETGVTLSTWDAMTGAPEPPIAIPWKEDEEANFASHYSPGDRRLRLLHRLKDDKGARLREVPEGPLNHVLAAEKLGLANFSPKGGLVFLRDGEAVRVWETGSGRLLQGLDGDGSTPVDMQASPDDRLMLAVKDSTVHVWDPASTREPWRFGMEESIPYTCRFSATGKILAVSYRATSTRVEGKTVIYSMETGEKLLPGLGADSGAADDVTFSPNGTRIATLREGEALRLWDRASGQEIANPVSGLRGTHCCFSPDGRILVVYEALGKSIEVLDGESLEPVTRLHTPGGATDWEPPRFSADGKRLAAIVFSRRHTAVWDLDLAVAEREIVIDLDPWTEKAAGGAATVAWLCTSRNWQGYGKGLPLMREPRGFKDSLRRLDFMHQDKLSQTLSPDGRSVLAESGRHLRLWRCNQAEADPEPVWDLPEGEKLVALQMSPDGKTFVAGFESGAIVRVGIAKVGQLLPPLEIPPNLRMPPGRFSPSVKAFAFSKDGSRLAAGRGDGKLVVWDAATGTCLAQFQRPEPITAIVMDAEGKRVVHAAWKGGAEVLELEGEKRRIVLNPEGINLLAVNFSPDGLRVVMGYHDGTAGIWDPATGRELLQLRKLDSVGSVAFSQDGRDLIAVSIGGKIRIWHSTSARKRLRMREEEE